MGELVDESTVEAADTAEEKSIAEPVLETVEEIEETVLAASEPETTLTEPVAPETSANKSRAFQIFLAEYQQDWPDKTEADAIVWWNMLSQASLDMYEELAAQ